MAYAVMLIQGFAAIASLTTGRAIAAVNTSADPRVEDAAGGTAAISVGSPASRQFHLKNTKETCLIEKGRNCAAKSRGERALSEEESANVRRDASVMERRGKTVRVKSVGESIVGVRTELLLKTGRADLFGPSLWLVPDPSRIVNPGAKGP